MWELLSENTHIEQQNAALVLSAKRPSQSVPHMKHQKPGLAYSVGLKRHACTKKHYPSETAYCPVQVTIQDLKCLLESALYTQSGVYGCGTQCELLMACSPETKAC